MLLKVHGHNLKFNVKNVLERVLAFFEDRLEYDSEVHRTTIFRLKGVKINPGSFDDQLVTEWMDMSLSMLKTLDHLKENMCKYGQPRLGCSLVYEFWLWLKPMHTVINPKQKT